MTRHRHAGWFFAHELCRLAGRLLSARRSSWVMQSRVTADPNLPWVSDVHEKTKGIFDWSNPCPPVAVPRRPIEHGHPERSDGHGGRARVHSAGRFTGNITAEAACRRLLWCGSAPTRRARRFHGEVTRGPIRLEYYR